MPTEKAIRRKRRHIRIRKKVSGTKSIPRLYVFRGLSHIYAQLINDTEGKTILSCSDIKTKKEKGTKTEKAKKVGQEIAKLAKEKGIEKVTFDRGGNKFHGRIKALAEGAREGGLQF